MNINKLRIWTGLSQKQFAQKIGITRAALAKIETSAACASTRLINSIIDAYSPCVLFINHSPSTPTIINAMLAIKQIDTTEHEPDAFNAALKQGLTIAVITDDKTPFLNLIAKAVEDSGLPEIPTRGILVGENNEIRPEHKPI